MILTEIARQVVVAAWCWYDLARTLNWLRAPETEVLMAYTRAMELLPDEPTFGEGYERWRADRRS